MISRRILSASVVLMLTTVACGNASFFGGGAKKSQTAPGNQPPVNQGPGGTAPNGQTPNGQTPNGQTPNGQTPNGPSNPNPQSSQPQIGPGDQMTQPNPNTAVFGRDMVFHIGDGRFDNTSCKDQVAALPLSGTAYFFQFEVLNDNTSVTVNAARICGVDYGTNTFELYSGTTRIQGKFIPRAIFGISAEAIILKRGVYSVVLTSGLGRDAGDATNDRDDYIVGNVTVQGTQPVRPLQYGTYNRR